MRSPVTIQYRLVARDSSAPGAQRVPVRGSTASVAVEGDTIITEADIADAREETRRWWSILSGSHRASDIRITLRPDGARKLAQASAAHIGDQLVIVVNGEVVSQAIIRDPISGNEFMISGGMTKEEARALARLAGSRKP
ncbi:MAG: hypothetical protein ABJD11_13170 [Gemmatimonadota bacterium]